VKPFPLVVEFMRAFGQRVPDSLEMPDDVTKSLRAKLCKEERKELDEAKDLTEYLDAVVDSLYVTLGAAAAAGFTSETIAEAFWEVHRSNMSKLWTNGEVQDVRDGTNATSLGDLSGGLFDNRYDVTRAVVDHGTKRCLIVKRKDGKVIKSPGYAAADVGRFIYTQAQRQEDLPWMADHSPDAGKTAALEAANRELIQALEGCDQAFGKHCPDEESRYGQAWTAVKAALAKHKGAV
jgi:hypothetical protein